MCAVGVAALGILLAGCGDEAGRVDSGNDGPFVAGHSSRSLVPAGYDGRFRTSATVLESPAHGPQLCHYVLDSLPPQCEGLNIAGWEWAAVRHESANGTRWGEYTVVGTYDGKTFTLTEPATGPSWPRDPGGDHLVTPCPEPDGGWQPVNPDLATDAGLNAAVRRARDVEGSSGVWVDQRIPEGELTEQNANDPMRLVLNVTTVGDPLVMEQEIREVWGGALCVSMAERTMAELQQVQRQVGDMEGVLSSDIDEVTGQVGVSFLVATEELQHELDDRYGAGAVRLFGTLEPID
ncbi:MAG: hypothetical protein ACR2JT_03170 [Nocardioidaceae bacterium]